jgi:hypothetical protein
MRRVAPYLFFAASAAIFVTTACSTVGALMTARSMTFSEQQIQEKLVTRFPRDYKRLGGLLTITLMNPRLSIPAGERRLRIDFDVAVGALGAARRSPDGRFTLTSALRYDPASRALHFFEPRIEGIEIAALGGSMNDNFQGALNEWLSDWAKSEPIYQFDNSLIGRMGSRRVEGTRIENGQVVVDFGG